jgi:hypothetical protein
METTVKKWKVEKWKVESGKKKPAARVFDLPFDLPFAFRLSPFAMPLEVHP